MAATDFPLNHPQAVKHWSGDVFKEALKMTQAFKFMGKGSNALCQVRNEMKSEGDRVRVGLRLQLDGDGVEGDGTLEGNEESLQIYHDDVFIDQLRHATRSKGKMSEQRVPFSVREESRDGLADWWSNRFDTSFFNQLSGNTGETRTKYTGMQSTIAPNSGNTITPNATSTASLAAADTFGIEAVDYCVETATYPIRKVAMKGGVKAYAMFIHSYQKTDLRRSYSSGDWGDLQKAAINGGKITGNPIFTGALGMYNDTVLHSTTRLPSIVANTRRWVFAGAQAASIAFGKGNSLGNKFSWVEELFDYGNQLGVSAGSIWGLKKMVYNNIDFATITGASYAVAHTS